MAELSIYEKLAQVQNELKAPKSQHNSFGKYNYRSAEDILEAVKPLCTHHRLALTLSDEIVFTCGRWHVVASARLQDMDSDKEIVVNGCAREEESKKGMDGAQITGCASSYARKYALNGLFCIDDTKDSDTDEYRNIQNNADSRGRKASQAQTTKTTTKTSHGGNEAQNKEPETVKDYYEMVIGKAEMLDCKKIVTPLIKEKFGKEKFSELSLVEAKAFYDHMDEFIAQEDNKLMGDDK